MAAKKGIEEEVMAAAGMTEEDVVVECGTLMRRVIQIGDCAKEKKHAEMLDCERQYDMYVPTSACEKKDRKDIGYLPLVLAVHCHGCGPNVMYFWHEIAEEFQFVLAIPHGVENSFNAQHCCGFAQENNIDDVGFLKSIIKDISTDYGEFVDKDLAYGLGWSNGGYLVALAANLFRGISPVAGYEVDLPKVDHPVAIFMHHSESDETAQITGCCADGFPQCSEDITPAEHCTPAMSFFEEFGKQANSCQHGPGEIVFQGDEDEIDSVVDIKDGVTCYEQKHCKTNTTYCVHRGGGHFNKPNFEVAFDMQNDVAEFFARDACSVDKGVWASDNKTCVCKDENNLATYCLADSWDHVHEEFVEEQEIAILSSAVTLFWVAFCLLLYKCCSNRRKHRKNKQVVQEAFSMMSDLELIDFDDTAGPQDAPLSMTI